jgi:glycosyltransferase involved in cell wall biosynthesis
LLNFEIISPVFNEEEGISDFLKVVNVVAKQINSANQNVLIKSIILVNDGSSDSTLQQIEASPSELNIKVINFSRNFGHQAAVWAGLQHSDSDSCVIVLDADLQDPPSEIHRMIQQIDSGMDVVLMQRITRSDSFTKKFFATLYYKLLSVLDGGKTIRQTADFFGLSVRAKEYLLLHTESIKYIRGLLTDIGLRRVVLGYDRNQRIKGSTHYTITKMFGLAVAGITGFSTKPLVLIAYMAFTGGLIGFCLISYIAILKYIGSVDMAPGFAFATTVNTFFQICTLIALAVIAIYIARITHEVKRRPDFIVESTLEIRKL